MMEAKIYGSKVKRKFYLGLEENLYPVKTAGKTVLQSVFPPSILTGKVLFRDEPIGDVLLAKECFVRELKEGELIVYNDKNYCINKVVFESEGIRYHISFFIIEEDVESKKLAEEHELKLQEEYLTRVRDQKKDTISYVEDCSWNWLKWFKKKRMK